MRMHGVMGAFRLFGLEGLLPPMSISRWTDLEKERYWYGFGACSVNTL